MRKQRATRLDIAKSDIMHFFDEQPFHIYTPAQMKSILDANRDSWNLPQSTGLHKFVHFLSEKATLKEIELFFPSFKAVRYAWGEVSDYEIALSVKENSYLSHYTAMFLHELTEQFPKTIYVTFPQFLKSNGPFSLSQERIDSAFKRRPRISNNIAPYKDINICLLYGMNLGILGLTELEVDGQTLEREKIIFTDIERTIIDITVRPFYAGGVFEVLKAYRLAKGKVSINKLSAMLKKINYIYPYHQAIGFYLERAGGYKDSVIRIFKKFDMKYDFYLTYQMREVSYSKEWRLYYPKGF